MNSCCAGRAERWWITSRGSRVTVTVQKAECTMPTAKHKLSDTVAQLRRIVWVTTLLIWGLNLVLLVCQFSFLSHLLWTLLGGTSYSFQFSLQALQVTLHLFQQRHLLQTRAGKTYTHTGSTEQEIICSYPWTINFHICIHGLPLLVLLCPLLYWLLTICIWSSWL